MMYALNDFDDTYSVSDAADLSMYSGSIRQSRSGLPFLETGYGHVMQLEPSSKVMKQMAANSSSKPSIMIHRRDEVGDEEDGAVRMAINERRNSNMSLDLPVTPGIRQPELENAMFNDNSFQISP